MNHQIWTDTSEKNKMLTGSGLGGEPSAELTHVLAWPASPGPLLLDYYKTKTGSKLASAGIAR